MFDTYLKEQVDQREIPGAVLMITQGKEEKYHQAFGHFRNKDAQRQMIHHDTLFDIASLTKVVATTPALLLLLAKKKLSLKDPVQAYIPEFRFKDVTLGNLITHSSGLPADLIYMDRQVERNVLKDILSTNLIYEPNNQVVYSDLGMILLGKVIETVTNQPLHTFVQQHLFNPWGLFQTKYLLTEDEKKEAAATEKYRGTFIQGEVHDEKAYQLGQVSGSAGLFATASDLAQFAHYMLFPETQDILPTQIIENALIPRGGNRGLGFQVYHDAQDPLACGEKWPLGTFGHTGFTGTSLWVDPSKELVVVFLTNAVHFGRNTKLKEIRSTLHSLIYSFY
ncbi:beta-lactamase family protein [Radiobacillus kanasensis]|uniref:serine hydrolase domain-containing protein n=1 Tax=Radiobacillus kanasensis TaxID=2844358 RepID=UPI001E3941CD|nr:serine hydrolase domain-containing protein [Radiobacillus kanasensis]UFT98712.1 beta-lactamase family protein [Radiobacillus kanasensis]